MHKRMARVFGVSAFVLLAAIKMVFCLFGVIAVLLLSEIVGDWYAHGEKGARKYIKSTSAIEVPEDGEMIFIYRRECFQERTLQYAVFKFAKLPTDWMTERAFSEEKNGDFESDFNSYLRGWYADEKIPAAYIPDFNESYFWLNVQAFENALDREYFVCYKAKRFYNTFILIVYIT